MIHTIFLNRLFFELVDDLMIIIAFLFMAGYFLREHRINHDSRFIKKILLSLGGGFMGFILIINNFELSSTKTIVDLRYISIVLVFYMVGIFPAFITSVLLFLTRILLYDMSTGSIVYFINSLIMLGILYFIERKVKIRKKRLLWYLVTSSLMVFITFIILLIQDKETYQVLIDFFLLASIASIVIYFFMDYIETSNDLFRKYKESSTKDFLTGLYNTRSYDYHFNKIVNRLIHSNEQLAYFFIDIDHFKEINDRYGHTVGDEILKHVANYINQVIRSGDLLFRVGGEEFCLLVLNVDESTAYQLGERIRTHIEKSSFVISHDKSIHMTVSIGLSIYPTTVTNVHVIKESADKALYMSKASGRNKVSVV